MKCADLMPAVAIAVCTTAVLSGVQLLPLGTAMLLVRIPADGMDQALQAAALADAALVDVPAPGFAIVYGDAAQVRHALGLATVWNGSAPCSTLP